MSDLSVYMKIVMLPKAIKAEVLHYIDDLIAKKRIDPNQKKHPKAGCMKGTFEMADDFDEPLDDFKEYME